MDPQIATTAELLLDEHSTSVEIEDRTIRLVDPVRGDPGFAVLRVLGLAQAGSPVGAAAHGPEGVAIGVWRSPELYLARWGANGKRWVVGYRLTGGSRPNDYVRTEGRIPSRLELGNWYGAAPDSVGEVFFEAGLLLDDPPFPVPTPPPRTIAAKAPSSSPPASRSSRATARPASAAANPGTRAPKAAAPTPRPERGPTTRLCPSCRMQKAVGQFVAGSDLCVDCR